ncbi:uncharacterized protein LOC144556957 [Carex rostrata]
MATKKSNLQCFLYNVTPSVDSHFLFKSPYYNYGSSSRNWWPDNKNCVEYFTLSDLWDSLYEWSAYGASTNVVLPNGETLVQYFAPYLSAVQLYTNEMCMLPARNVALQNGMYWYGNEYYNQDLYQPWNTLSLESMFSKMNLGDAENNLGCKYFEYFEMSSPYTRMPLVDKVQELGQNFPGLKSLKSIELTPASWMSISWYPIYTIPAQLDRDNYSTCFLTYHSLCPSQDDTRETLKDSKSDELPPNRNKGKQKDEFMTISLPPFALASHKVNGALWNNPETGDGALAETLLCAAGDWLRQVQTQHHDFNFFITH